MTLTEAAIINELSNTSDGEVVQVTYKSELPLKASSKKAGHTIYKISEVDAIIGVPYSQFPEVIEYRRKKLEENFGVMPESTRKNNYEQLLANRLFYNTNTDKKYVRFVTQKELPRRCKYIVDGIETDFLTDDEKELVINSYWNKPEKSDDEKNLPIQQNINIENIITFGTLGESQFD